VIYKLYKDLEMILNLITLFGTLNSIFCVVRLKTCSVSHSLQKPVNGYLTRAQWNRSPGG